MLLNFHLNYLNYLCIYNEYVIYEWIVKKDDKVIKKVTKENMMFCVKIIKLYKVYVSLILCLSKVSKNFFYNFLKTKYYKIK